MGGAVAAQHVALRSSTLTHVRQARLGQSPRRDPAWPFTTDHAVACVLHAVTCVALFGLRAGCCTLRAASCSRITSVVVIWSLMNDRSFSTVAKLSFAVVIFLFSSAFASSNGYSSICQTNTQTHKPTNQPARLSRRFWSSSRCPRAIDPARFRQCETADIVSYGIRAHHVGSEPEANGSHVFEGGVGVHRIRQVEVNGNGLARLLHRTRTVGATSSRWDACAPGRTRAASGWGTRKLRRPASSPGR